MIRRRARSLRTEIDRVVAAGNCSGCGACALLSPGVRMEQDRAGYARPVWPAEEVDPGPVVARSFRRICPGVAVVAMRRDGRRTHPTMGEYVSVWRAWASDAEIREAGSSGGVLSALSGWMLAEQAVTGVQAAAASAEQPGRTVTVQLRTRAEVIEAAGSRYAPVANAARFDPDDRATAFIGKPCEVYAARRLTQQRADPPLLLSFFCAGVPSQHATDELVTALGVDVQSLVELRYRGDGWPGQFRARDQAGVTGTLSYERSWGDHLGKRLQDRCKICPDGTGGHADVAVGDLWAADANGYPIFTEGAGVSVAVARTIRGHELLQAAHRAGVLVLEPVEMDEVAGVQPFQSLRRATLLGRLVGRRLAGVEIPQYRGFHLIRLGLARPRRTASFARGSFARARAGSARGDG